MALKEARASNRHVEAYLLAKERLPARPPGYYQPGKKSEALVCVRELGEAWRRHPEAVEWLRKNSDHFSARKMP